MQVKNKFRLIGIPYYLWIAAFVVLPIILVFYKSLFDVSGNFSLINYKTFFSPIYLQMTFNSILYAVIISTLCLIIAYPTAYIISKQKHQKLLLMLIVLPSWVNLLLKTYAFMGILATDGFINQTMDALGLPPIQFLFDIKGFLIVSIYIFVPFMVLPIYNSIIQIPVNLTSAARDLGASSYQIFKSIILPLTKNGVGSALQLVFIPSLSIFMITRLIAGNRIITLGTAIEEHFLVTGNWGMGSAIGTILIIFLFGSIALMQYPKSKYRKKKNVDSQIVSGGANA